MVDIDELLAKTLADEASPEEAAQVQAWLEAAPENRQYFSGLQWLWGSASQAQAPLSRPVDAEAALQKVKAGIANAAAPTRPQAKIVPLRRWTAIAAAVAALVAAVYFLRPAAPVAPVEIAATTTVLADTLTDGSIVTLNKRSGLTAQLGRRERRVRLRGEAHFAVAPDAAKPFVVAVQQLEIRVLGTRFNVDNLSDARITTVTVEEGRVEMRIGSEALELTAGQQAVYDGVSLRRTDRIDPNAAAYRDRKFVFDSTPLREVAIQLTEVYGIPVELAPTLLDCELSTRFNNLPLDEVLNIIADSFVIQIIREADRIILKGTCM